MSIFGKILWFLSACLAVAILAFAMPVFSRLPSAEPVHAAHSAASQEGAQLASFQGAPALSVALQITPTMTVTATAVATTTVPATVSPTAAATQPITSSVPVTMAIAEMHNISGTLVATARLTETADGVQVALDVAGLTDAAAGPHGIHFHQVGSCEPDFASAGAHFNPMMKEHGLENPEGAHAGDLPNIEFDANGSATYSASAMASLQTGPTALLDADGTALVIHSEPDDQMSNPAGWSGGRIACGVVTAMGVPMPPAAEKAPPIQGTNFEPALRTATTERINQLQAPDGFEISAFGQGLGSVRMMAEADDGTIYVTRRGEGDVLGLRDQDGDGMVDMPPLVAASNLPSVHGIIVQGPDVWLATPTTIYKGTIAEDGTFHGLTGILNDMPPGGQHGNRTMAFGPDGMLYVSVGSPCNACGFDNPEYATILQIQPDGSSRTVFAEGLRNTIGWGWHPETGQLWGMDHGSDWRGDDQPPEELNMLVQGNNYGWPYCYGNKQVDPYIATDPRGMTKTEFCARSSGPVLTYQAHSAPIGMVYYTGEQFPEMYRNDAFVAMRGSWNRNQAVGYKVVRIDFDDAGQPTGFEDFITGWLIEDGTAQFGRIAGLLVLKDGSLLVSDDTNGVVYKVEYTAE